MGYRRHKLMGALAAVIVVALPAMAQTASSKGAGNAARTLGGHPDFEGIWSNAVSVPLERPKELGAK